MNVQCPTSCGLCSPQCADIHTGLQLVEACAGQCEEQPGLHEPALPGDLRRVRGQVQGHA